MDKRAYYQKYYKVIRLMGFLLLLVFYPVFYTLAADDIEGYGWSDEEHIVIGTEDKDIMVFDGNGALMRIFSVEILQIPTPCICRRESISFQTGQTTRMSMSRTERCGKAANRIYIGRD